jgi:hypothetical protein
MRKRSQCKPPAVQRGIPIYFTAIPTEIVQFYALFFIYLFQRNNRIIMPVISMIYTEREKFENNIEKFANCLRRLCTV